MLEKHTWDVLDEPEITEKRRQELLISEQRLAEVKKQDEQAGIKWLKNGEFPPPDLIWSRSERIYRITEIPRRSMQFLTIIDILNPPIYKIINGIAPTADPEWGWKQRKRRSRK